MRPRSAGAVTRNVSCAASGNEEHMGEMQKRMLRGELYRSDDPENAAEPARVHRVEVPSA